MDDEHRERIRAAWTPEKREEARRRAKAQWADPEARRAAGRAAGGRRNLTEAERERRRIRTRRYMVKAHLARMPDDERIRLLAELLELYGFQAQLPG